MLSIVIPTYNEENFLPRLLDSIVKQNVDDYEIIVSDAGSKDRTIEIAKKYNCRIVIDDKHRCPASQRNNGAYIAKGELLVFFDADTVLLDKFLSKAILEIKKRDLKIAGVYIKFNPNSFIYFIYAKVYNFFTYLRQYYSPVSVGACIFISKDIHKRIKGFDTSLYVGEDYDYCQRASKAGKFKILRSCKISYSSRRFEREGIVKTTMNYLFMFMYTFFGKKIKSKIINYEMGGRK